jgi:hypothetical protein
MKTPKQNLIQDLEESGVLRYNEANISEEYIATMFTVEVRKH